jgi:hypothetical protein
MDEYYYERNQFLPRPAFAPVVARPAPINYATPGYGPLQGITLGPPPAPPAPFPPYPPPVGAYPPPMPYPPPGAPPPWFGQWGGSPGSGLLGGLFGNRRALPIIVDQVLKGWAAFSGTPTLPTGQQLNEVSNLFAYLDSAAQYVKRDEQIRFFGGLARDIL